MQVRCPHLFFKGSILYVFTASHCFVFWFIPKLFAPKPFPPSPFISQEELYQQGDQERALGLPLSPLMDRDRPGVMRSQTTFVSVVARPMYQAMAQVFPGTMPLMEGLAENFKYWQDVEGGLAGTTRSGGGGA